MISLFQTIFTRPPKLSSKPSTKRYPRPPPRVCLGVPPWGSSGLLQGPPPLSPPRGNPLGDPPLYLPWVIVNPRLGRPQSWGHSTRPTPMIAAHVRREVPKVPKTTATRRRSQEAASSPEFLEFPDAARLGVPSTGICPDCVLRLTQGRTLAGTPVGTPGGIPGGTLGGNLGSPQWTPWGTPPETPQGPPQRTPLGAVWGTIWWSVRGTIWWAL